MPATSLKPIQTRYRGHHFRSRLEARWAVFFDAMGFKWEYEPEGFDLDGKLYLPDFRVWTPQGNPIWYEVKPARSATDEKFFLFVDALHNELEPDECDTVRAELLDGAPWENHMLWNLGDEGLYVCPRCGFMQKHQRIHRPIDFIDCGNDSMWSYYCWPCDSETPSGGGNQSEPGFIGAVTPHKGHLLVSSDDFHLMRDTIFSAIRDSKSARFEHGESGAT
jgi:hypothetical protein